VSALGEKTAPSMSFRTGDRPDHHLEPRAARRRRRARQDETSPEENLAALAAMDEGVQKAIDHGNAPAWRALPWGPRSPSAVGVQSASPRQRTFDASDLGRVTVIAEAQRYGEG
jgi:hypothetical protein